jgi:hypothetical protein
MTLVLFPEWTVGMIALHAVLAINAVGVGPMLRAGPLKLRYSKFRSQTGISGRTGMFILYFVPLVVQAAVSAPYLGSATLIQWLVFGAVSLHFVKRCLEVMFVHSYSGPIDVPTTVMITGLYSSFAATLAWFNARPLANLDAFFLAGVALFVLGELSNLYHHVLLAQLRKGAASGYFIPTGGLFAQVTTPHYFTEIIAWVGIALMSRHLAAYLVVGIMAHYLADRANTTQQWYREKFPDYPRERKRIFPFVY